MIELVEPRFAPGQLVVHMKFGYRGVVVDVDASFSGTEEWYTNVARSKPPKDQPWYRVLVHGADHETYVAERHLENDLSGDPVDHPMVAVFFDELQNGSYHRERSVN